MSHSKTDHCSPDIFTRRTIHFGKKDKITNAFLPDNHMFANLCNFYLFDGQPVINSDELSEQDTSELIEAISSAEKAFGINDKSLSIQK